MSIEEMEEKDTNKPETAPAKVDRRKKVALAMKLAMRVVGASFLVTSGVSMIEAAAMHGGPNKEENTPSSTPTARPESATATAPQLPETTYTPIDLAQFPPRHFKSLEEEKLSLKTYDSAEEAFAAIQKGVNGKPQGECMAYPYWPGGRTNDWFQAVSDFLDAHPADVPYQDGTGGIGGVAQRTDKKGWCFVAYLPLSGGPGGVPDENETALVYEGIGLNGPETQAVIFKGSPDSSGQ